MRPFSYRSQHDKQRDSGTIPVLLAVTPAFACVFFEGLLSPLRAAGFAPVLVSAPGEQLPRIAQSAGVEYAAIPMDREISPAKDLLVLWRFYRLIRRINPAIADVSTPKAGLLGGLAAVLAGVPCRLYTLRGLRFETTRGWKRRLLSLLERVSVACAHKVICVGPSLRDRALELHLVGAEKTVILGNGSCGIDIHRFSTKVRSSAIKQSLLEEIKIPSGAPVIGFVGRLTRDKGIPELVEAFLHLEEKNTDLRLLLVGDFEDGDPVPAITRDHIRNHSRIVKTGFVPDTAPYYRLMDVLAFPTHREGFGEVSLEAQASEIPVVTTKATGVVDSVVDGVTGFLVPVGNSEMLADKIGLLLKDRALRTRMGQAGRRWVVERFKQEIVANALVQEYRRLLRHRKINTLELSMDGGN
jgi:glycosyltransferase involved in cell wall biosynthesis